MSIGVACRGVRRRTMGEFSETPEAIADLVPKGSPGRKAEELNPFRTPVRFWGQGTQIPSNLFPIGPKTRLQS